MESSGELLGESPEILAVRQKIRELIAHGRRAGRLPPILVQGETGTGKGLVAHLIHRNGPRRTGPFVDVNCAAIPEALLEAELFGFEQGAFTDARQAKPGLFEAAHGGTLFLDEIGLLPGGLQAKLLKVIEERSVRRLGGTRVKPVDVWLVAASGEDIAAATAARHFRSDLYHRISVLTLQFPPLRRRRGDILLLASHFLARAGAEYGLPEKTLAADARAALLNYSWPGNVRELSNVMERVALLTDSPVITASLLQLTETGPPGTRAEDAEAREQALGSAVEEMERVRIVEALHRTGGNVSRAATLLRISRDRLRYRVAKYGLQPSALTSRRVRPRPPAAVRASPNPDTRPAAAIQWADRLLAALRVILIPPTATHAWTELGRAIEFLVEKARGFGGRVEEIGPDGVVAVFGLDRSGDAAARAALAALAIQQAAARADRSDLARVSGKAAIHTGRFSVGQVSGAPEIALDAKRDALAILDTLISRAEDGTIVIDEGTAPFLDRRFDLVALDAAASRAGRAYRLVGRKGAEFWGRLTTFVGRRDELTMLRGRLALAVRGQGQAVAIVGEPGIGKSRLLFEFRQSVAGERAPRFVEAHCFAFTSNTPYLPVLEVLRNLCGLSEGETSASVAEKVRTAVEAIGTAANDVVPYLLDVLGIAPVASPLVQFDPDVARARTFEALRKVYVGLSRTRPLIIAVEDLQWIDRTSDEFLASLVDDLPGAPILFLSTYRPGYRPRWMDRSYATQIALPPLSPEESQGLLHSMLPPDRALRQLAPAILAKAEGNPFFLEELARVVNPEADPASLSVPDTIQDVLMARIDHLSPDAKNVLQVASVYGQELPLPLLDGLGEAPGVLGAHLRELVQREFVSVRGGLCVFTHALTQEVAYRSLSDDMRRRCHGRVARNLLAMFPHVVDAQPELLAHHFTSAGIGAEAVQYWLRAGQQARGRSAYTEAINHLTRGLDLVATLAPGPQRSEQEIGLQLALGASLGPRKGFASPEVARAYTRARQLCQEIGQSARLFNALSGLEMYYFARGELRRARELGDEGVALAAELGDSSVACRSSNAMGGVLVHIGEPAAAWEHLERAVGLVDAATDRASPYHSSVTHPLVFAFSYESWALWLLGHPNRALRASEEALAISARLDHPHTRVFALHYANVFRQLRRDVSVIPAQADAVIALATEHGFPPFCGLGIIMRGWGLAQRGEIHEGLAEIRRGLVAYRDTGTELGRPFFLGLLAATHARAGQWQEALGVLAEAITLGRERGERAWEPELLRQEGEVLLAGPVCDVREAERSFGEAIACARSQSARSWELRAATSLGRLLARQGRRLEARDVLSEAYRAFVEGFDTIDLVEARVLLEQLSA